MGNGHPTPFSSNDNRTHQRPEFRRRMMRLEQLERRDLLTAAMWEEGFVSTANSPLERPMALSSSTFSMPAAEGEGPGVDYGDAPDVIGVDSDKDGIDDGVDRSPTLDYIAFASPAYNTLVRNDGPAHTIVEGLFLGQRVDDTNGLPNYAATGDDADGSPSDDDGVVDPYKSLLLVEGQSPEVSLLVTNQTGKEATLAGWIDYNRDGVFDNATERAVAQIASGSSGASVTLVFPKTPVGAGGQTYSRFRLSTDESFTADPIPTGAAADGEVEDYGPYVTFDRGDGNDHWINAQNWNGNLIPQSIDSVVIAKGQTVLFWDPNFLDQTHAITMLHVEEGARLIGSNAGGDRLTISGSATIDGRLDLQAGELSGDGTWYVMGDLFWSGGTLGGGTPHQSFKGTVELHGTTQIIGSGIKTTGMGTLRNFGTIEYTGKELRHLGGTFVNEESGVFEFRTDGDYTRSDGGNNWINHGTLRIFAGDEDGVTFYANPYGSFINEGLIQVDSGVFLVQANGSGDGRFELGPTAQIQFVGAYEYGTGSQFVGSSSNDGSSIVRISLPGQSEFKFAGEFDVPRLIIDSGFVKFSEQQPPANLDDVILLGGALGGTGIVNINGELDWRGGNLGLAGDGIGEVHLLGNTRIRGANNKAINTNNQTSTEIFNEGTIQWTGTGNLLSFGGNFFNNGLFRIQTDAGLTQVDSLLRMINRGTIIKEPDPSDPSIGLASQNFSAETLRNLGTIEISSGGLVHSTRFGCNSSTCGLLQEDGGRIVLAGGDLLSTQKIHILGGEITGTGNIFANIDQSGGALNPGDSPGRITVGGSHNATSPNVDWNIEIAGPPLDDESNTTAGVNFDWIRITANAHLDGTLSIATAPGFTPTVGDVYEIVTANALSGTFDNIIGQAISVTQAWQVDYTSTSVTLTVVELDESQIAEQIRQQFNQGVLATRESLPAWLNAGEVGLPGSEQKIGDLFATHLDAAAAGLLPTADNVVTTADELRTQLQALGYVVDCIYGDENCDSPLEVSLADASLGMSLTTQTDANSFESLSKLPAGVELLGDLDWNGTFRSTNLAMGIDAQGFYLDPTSQFELAITGGGNVSDQDFVLPGNGLTLDFDGTLIVPDSEPVVAALDLNALLRPSAFGEDPNSLFTVHSSGETTLAITHTLTPGGLTYDGVWSIRQDCSSDVCRLQEISPPDVDYPSTDDWLATGIDLFGGIIDTLMGSEAAANFNEISLPLIGDAAPSDTAPQLVGINTAELNAPESSWLDKLFGAGRSIFNFFDSGDGSNTVPSEGQGQFHTEGDRLIGTDVVRFNRDVDGSGIKIGVISTGADGLLYSQVSGDVPAGMASFINEDAFGGRGTAMLEVIHDIAPGAELAFASATDATSLFTAINWLIELQHVDVIVSDVIDYSAPMFGVDSTTDLIRSRLEEHDVLFVQAAGNDGQRAYRGELELVSIDDGFGPRTVHRFGGTPETPVVTLPVELEPQSVVRLVLQTNQPFNRPTARVVADALSLPEGVELNRIGFPLGSSSGRESGIPETVDSFTLVNQTQAPVSVDLIVELLGGELSDGEPTEFQLVALGNAALGQTQGPSLFGAARLQDVLVVGATEISQSQQAAAYSSSGSATGRKPDVVAPAGVESSGFGMRFYGEFHGTSSSAAHVAAAVGLLKQIAPGYSNDQIREALKSTAKVLSAGSDELRAGAGLIDVVAAAQLLDPLPGEPQAPPAAGETGLLDYLTSMPQILGISLPTQREFEDMLSGVEDIATDLLQMQVVFDSDSLGVFEADFPFNFDGIGSFDTFDISGRIGFTAEPNITFYLGWDAGGPYVDTAASKVAANLTGIGQAQGSVFDTFGLGAGATVTAQPSMNLLAIDRGDDGKIGLDDAQALADDFLQGKYSLVIPQLNTVDAELYGDVILGFLDYVDVDPELLNRPHGGDPFIIRGRANLQLDFTGPELAWTFSDLRVANPDINGDEQPDYTLGALAENAIRFGETLINAIEVPDFVRELLGEVGIGGDARRGDPIQRPRGMLPEQFEDTAEANTARTAINTHIANALAAAGQDGSQVDETTLANNIKRELTAWLDGGESAGPSGEGLGDLPILTRLEVLFNDVTRAQVDDPETPQDEFEISLNQAISSYWRWKSALEIAGFEPEQVASPAQLTRLEERLVGSLQYAIQRSHVGAIELHLAGAPLNHQYNDVAQADGSTKRELVQRGVIDRAIEAVRWAQAAEYLQLATPENGLSVSEALDEMAIRVDVEQSELVFNENEPTDGYIGPEDFVLLNVKAGWRIKLPPAGSAPDIPDYPDYEFGDLQYDGGGNLSVNSSGASNNNRLGGQQLLLSKDPVTGLPRSAGDALPITQGVLDQNGTYSTQVRLGEGDTFAQVQVDVGLQYISMANERTEVIQGRPSIQLLGAHGSEDETSLRKTNLIVEPGGLIAFEARIRRGNGPLAGTPLNFYLEGGGSLDQVEQATSYHVPQTAKDGTTTGFYTAHFDVFDEVKVGVAYFENGRIFQDELEILVIDAPEYLGGKTNPIAQSDLFDDDDAAAAKTALDDAVAGSTIEDLPPEARDGLQPLIVAWFNSVEDAVEAAAEASTSVSQSNIQSLQRQVANATGAYMEWLGHAGLLNMSSAVDQSSVQLELMGALESMVDYWLDRFDGSPAHDGLGPLYEALGWADAIETLLTANSMLLTHETSTYERVTERSGVAIEILPADATATAAVPTLTGTTDNATLKLKARVIKRWPDGSTTPVMESVSVPAAVEVFVSPPGNGQASIDIPPDQLQYFASATTSQTSSDSSSAASKVQRSILLGSRPRFVDRATGWESIPVQQFLTAQVQRGASDRDLSVVVQLGIPGVPLRTEVVELKDPPQLELLGATGEDSVLKSSLVLEPGQEAYLQVSLNRNNRAVNGDVQLSVIGRGRLVQSTAETGPEGVVGGIEYIAPATPLSPGDTHGVSQITASFQQDGKIYTSTITIRYEYDALGNDGELRGTPDFIRASNRLEQALHAATSIDETTGLPDVDEALFSAEAVVILNDWWNGNDTQEGGVVYWLQQVQSPANGGAYAIDTEWNNLAPLRDQAYRDALDSALENWFQWQAVAAQLQINQAEIISATRSQLAKTLISDAMTHANSRVHARCQARATDYLAARSSTPPLSNAQLEELLARLIIEGDKSLDYYSRNLILSKFNGIEVSDLGLLQNQIAQSCYEVVLLESESYLVGTPQSAQVHVKAGIRIPGLEENGEPVLLLPPPTAPLLVRVDPVGNATLDGLGLGRTDANGIYDRSRVSIGEGDEQLAVDVSVVLDFDNLDDPAARAKTRGIAYASRRLTLDATERVTIAWAKESEGPAKLSNQPRTLVDGERAMVELKVSKGRLPQIGKVVFVTKLGEGNLKTGLMLTDSRGRVRLYFEAPSDKAGRTQIAFAYQVDGESFVETMVLDYATSTNGVTNVNTTSRAQAIAVAKIGQHLAHIGLLRLQGGDNEVDSPLIESIQLEWLRSGLNEDGTLNPDQPYGVLARITEANQATPAVKRVLAKSALREYSQWLDINAQTALDESFNTQQGLPDSLVTLARASIDSYVNDALQESSAPLAKAALELALLFETEDFFDTPQDAPLYSFEGVLERLGYEVRVADAEIFGEADNALVQATVGIYLNDPNSTDGMPKLRSAIDTPIEVEAIPLGFRIVNAKQKVSHGLYGAEARIVDGDADLELVIRAKDEYAVSETTSVVKPGRFSFAGGIREESEMETVTPPSGIPETYKLPLSNSMEIYAGQSAIIEGRLTKGASPVPIPYSSMNFAITETTLSSPPTIEVIDGSRFRITVGDEAGTVTGIASSRVMGADTTSGTTENVAKFFQIPVTIMVRSGPPPSGEHDATTHAPGTEGGLLSNSHTVGAFNELDVPLAAENDEAEVGTAFGLDSIQLPFSGPMPSVGEFGRDLRDWFSNSFDLLHLVEFETVIDMLNGGLPVQPEELIRVKLDLAGASSVLPPTLLAADFSGLLPDGFEGSLQLDAPEIDGQIVFGIDTSNSPFYVLTKPDDLRSDTPSLQAFLDGELQDETRVGIEATELTAKFGVAATFNSTADLIDGILAVPHAEGYLSSRVAVDFSRVAAETGKLRFHQLDQLANLQVGFVGSPIDSFQAIASAELTLPSFDGGDGSNNPLANIEVIGAIHKPSLQSVGIEAADATAADTPWQFQLRTGDLFELPSEYRERLSSKTVDLSSTRRVEDDVYEDNDTWEKVTSGHAADLGTPIDRRTLGGRDPETSQNTLALTDAADWFRFQTTEIGNAASFVRVDFDRTRGDIDLGLYRLEGDTLVHIRTDALAFGNAAQINLLGQPAGTYFAKAFDDHGGSSPFYALTIDPPGRAAPGIDVTIGNFAVRDTSLELNVDSNLELYGLLNGRMVMTFGEQNGTPVELAFRAEIDTVADDPLDNGGFVATLGTSLGGASINILEIRDSTGEPIPPPVEGAWATTVDPALGGFLIFDYTTVDDFKFAGLDALTGRWVFGYRDAENGWVVPDDNTHRSVANVADGNPRTMTLIFNGDQTELWVNTPNEKPRKVLATSWGENLQGGIGLGIEDGDALFDHVTLRSGRLPPDPTAEVGEIPKFGKTLFVDSFTEKARDWWQLRKGVWRVDANGRYMASSTSIDMGDWLFVESGSIEATIDVQFNDTNILIPPPIAPSSTSAEGYVHASLMIDDVNALLFRVEDNEQGTKLYPELADSPKGLVAINDGSLTLTPNGVRLGAGRASAGLQDVLFVTLFDAEIDLTTSNAPLLSTGDILIKVPALSDSREFVTITGAAEPDEFGELPPLFGLSKPADADSIPEFLIFQDNVTIDFDTALVQEKVDVGGVFPFKLNNVGLRFNNAGDESGRIGNLSDFDLLVAGQFDFENSIFDAFPFDPIFAIGQPGFTNDPDNVERRVSSANAYVDECDSKDIFESFGKVGLCKNGFVSAELHLGALLGDRPELLIRNLGPIYVGFANAKLLEDPQLTFHGLVELGGFAEGRFVPQIAGSLAVTGSEAPLGSITVAGEFVGPNQVAGGATPELLDDEFESKLIVDWFGSINTELGSEFDANPNQAALNIRTEFTNRSTATRPFDLSFAIQPNLIDTGDICIDLGDYVQVCGSAVLNPDAADGEPVLAIREGSLKLGAELGPLAGVGFEAGGFGIGGDGTVYVLPAGYELEGAVFERGAFVEISRDVSGGLFGLPDWAPIVVTGFGLQFNGSSEDGEALVIGDGASPPNAAMALTNPSNFTFVISGGFQSNEMFPITSNFERLQVDLGKLTSCVAVAIDSATGVDLSEYPGHIFAAPCDFPIVGLDGLTIGIEPFELPGGVSIGGTLGLGVFRFERPVDPDDLSAGTEPQNVFYGIVEGEIVAADIGVGVSLIITQYGPVLARLKAGAPIPLGTLVGSLGGPVGAAIGTGSGFLVTGLEGGIVFGGDPLPVVTEPTDIFNVPQIRSPLRVTTADVRNAVEELAFENPTFSELLSLVTTLPNPDGLSYQQILVNILSGNPGLPVKFTWDDGYRIAVSGTLTNQYTAAQLGLGVTLGLNIGYDFDTLVHPGGAPAADAAGRALDAEGNLIQDSISGAIQTFDEAFGFQLYGFADIEVFGLSLVGAGIFLDFSEPLNPVFNVAAALPSKPGLLSILLPAQGEIGLQMDFDGYVEGSILSTVTFLQEALDAGSGFFFDVLTAMDEPSPLGTPSPLEQLAVQLEADRRYADGVDLGNPEDPDYDERYDPAKSGYDPADSATPDLWQQVLGSDTGEISRTMIIDRVRPDGSSGASILPQDIAGVTLEDLLGLNRLATKFVQEMFIRGANLLGDEAAALELTSNIPFWPAIKAQMLAVHQGVLLTVNDEDARATLQTAYEASLNVARVQAAFSYNIAKILYESGQAAVERFAEVFNPSLRITGQLSPMFLGFPMGPPSQSVDLTLNKHELTFAGEFSSLALALNTTGLPAFVKDRSVIEVHFPFKNLIKDLFNASLPTIDPTQGDWYGAFESSFSVLGLEVTNSQGLLFPAGADDLLAERIQVYNPTGDPFVLDPTKILVRNDHYSRLLEEGGILLDGRLTLPRFVTDPFTLIEELAQDEAFAPILAELAVDCDIDDIYGCIVSHPAEVMRLIGGLPAAVGAASTLEEVSQVQLFIPNFIDDVLAFDPQTSAELQALLNPANGTSMEELTDFLLAELGSRANLSHDILQDAYLIGAFGEMPAPFDGVPLPFPTTGKILGIPLGNGKLKGEVNDTGFELELDGTFLGLADVQFEASLNTALSDKYQDDNGNGVFDLAEPLLADRAPVGVYNAPETWIDANVNGIVEAGEYVDLDGNGVYNPSGDGFADFNFNGVWDVGDTFTTAQNSSGQWIPTTHDLNGNGVYDAAVMRVGGEFVVGAAPAACGILPTEFSGTEEAGDVADKLLSLFAHLGLTDDPAALEADIGHASEYAFEWIDLNLPSSAGGCVRAFSPGFDPSSTDPLRRTGGIEAYATLGIGNLLEGDFAFTVQPSSLSPLLPNVTARGSARQVLLPGFDGLNSSFDEAVLGSELEMFFSVIDGDFDASLEGSLTLLGKQFTLAGDTSLDVYSDGIVGNIQLSQADDLAISAGLVRLNGDFTLQFDTRPDSLSAAVVVTGDIQWPGFTLDDATFSIQVDSAGLHVQEISGHSNLFGAIDLEFTGSFDVLPADPFLDNVNLMDSIQLDVNLGPGDVHGEATVVVDRSGVSGTFSGYGNVLGAAYGSESDPIIRGKLNSGGCLALTAPVVAQFQLPGTGAFCGEAHNVEVALNVGEIEAKLEGDDSELTTVSLEVTATRFGATDVDFVVNVLWDVTRENGSSNLLGDLQLPNDRKLVFTFDDNSTTKTQTINFQIIGDNDFELRELFLVKLDPESISSTPSDIESVIGRGQAVLTVLNDDVPPVLTNLNAPNDALVFFNFDEHESAGPPAMGSPMFTTKSTQDVIPTPQWLEKFESSSVVRVGSTGFRSRAGLPAVFTEEDGNVALAESRGLLAQAKVFPSSIGPGNIQSSGTTFEFTVDPRQGTWRPNGIEFFVQGSASRGPSQDWALTWSQDNFAAPIVSSSDPSSTVAEADEFPGWTKHVASNGAFKQADGEGLLFCAGGPITFRLTNTSADASNWTIDNLALTGRHFVTDCLAQSPDEVAAEIGAFVEQQDYRIPGGFEILGPGHAVVRLTEDSGDIDPDPYDMLDIEIVGASPDLTTLRFFDNGQHPAASDLIRVNVHSASGVKFVDFAGASLFRGSVNIGGPVADGIQLGGLVEGSSIIVHNEFGVPVDITATGGFGEDVNVSVTGDIGSVNLADAWLGGLLEAGNIADVTIAGDFAADVAIDYGLGCFEVIGGNLSSESFETGLADGAGNGPADCITATSVDGVGGSIFGNLTIDGDVETVAANGGSIDVTLIAQNADLLIASIDEQTGTGGDMDGDIVVMAFDSIVTIGGTMSTSVTTTSTTIPSGEVSALPFHGQGGAIDSPNSFHFAGDVAGVIGHDINLRIVSDGKVGYIQAIAAAGTPASLVGNLTAKQFGEIRVAPGGAAEFNLTTTGEAWELNPQTAWNRIDAPFGSWLQNLSIPAGVHPGTIVVDQQQFDYSAADGMLVGNNQRLEVLRSGFQTEFFVIPASWQNVKAPLDVNDDGIVSPLDVLLIINRINQFGSVALQRPSLSTEIPAPYIDTSGDSFVSALDSLLVINYLNADLDGEAESVGGGAYSPDATFAQFRLAADLLWEGHEGTLDELIPVSADRRKGADRLAGRLEQPEFGRQKSESLMSPAASKTQSRDRMMDSEFGSVFEEALLDILVETRHSGC